MVAAVARSLVRAVAKIGLAAAAVVAVFGQIGVESAVSSYGSFAPFGVVRLSGVENGCFAAGGAPGGTLVDDGLPGASLGWSGGVRVLGFQNADDLIQSWQILFVCAGCRR